MAHLNIHPHAAELAQKKFDSLAPTGYEFMIVTRESEGTEHLEVSLYNPAGNWNRHAKKLPYTAVKFNLSSGVQAVAKSLLKLVGSKHDK